MAEFHRAIAVHDVPAGECREVFVAGRTIALYNVGGTFYATSNRCAHRGGPLGQGMLDGAVVMCPWHAWTFDVTTGETTADPSMRVECYPVKVEDGGVWVAVAGRA